MNSQTLPISELDTPMTHARIDGIEMGILADGTPYLTTRALARLCGQAPSVVYKITREWENERLKPRGLRIQQLLVAQGFAESQLFVTVELEGKATQIIPDAVCMAVLEYYAFEADTRKRHVALNSYRVLARNSLRRFIYTQVGYDPNARRSGTWQQLHERMMLNPTPNGYFSLLREISDILIPAIQLGLVVGPRTMPDISVGLMWARYWKERDLDYVYGPRRKHPHRFPEEFERPEVESWVYPNAALGEFRSWMQAYYLPQFFPRYLQKKALDGGLPAYRLEMLLSAVNANTPALSN